MVPGVGNGAVVVIDGGRIIAMHSLGRHDTCCCCLMGSCQNFNLNVWMGKKLIGCENGIMVV